MKYFQAGPLLAIALDWYHVYVMVPIPRYYQLFWKFDEDCHDFHEMIPGQLVIT
ncbi:MAG: hypothetical protein LKI72_04200 [Prevotella sp.]|nr:hypothetical protein [Prevotella sp.]MCI1685156.1 hypothetical protein [Prevotella sp.]MCI1816377.1 hypothetical protein [Prevotella sp.]MCI2179372.1 hypothetical protein [Prevotella sp.]